MFFRLIIFSLLLSPVAIGLPATEDFKFELYVFEGADWCIKCRALEKNILATAAFENFLIDNKINLIRVDFPQSKKQAKALQKQNKMLAERFKFPGAYPSIVIARKDTALYLYVNSANSLQDFERNILETIAEL